MKKNILSYFGLVSILVINTVSNADFKSEFNDIKQEYLKVRLLVIQAIRSKSGTKLVDADNKILSFQLRLEEFENKNPMVKTDKLYQNMQRNIDGFTAKIQQALSEIAISIPQVPEERGYLQQRVSN